MEKTQMNISVSKEVLKNFTEETKKKAINKSALLELFMGNWVKENKNK